MKAIWPARDLILDLTTSIIYSIIICMDIFTTLHSLLNNRKFSEAIENLNQELQKDPGMCWTKKTFIYEYLIMLNCKIGETNKAYELYKDFSATVDSNNVYLMQIRNRFYDLIFA